jgi:hypothetical protein
MSVYVVTWNLNKERANYANARAEFIKQLDTYEGIRDDKLETVRFVSSASSAYQVSEFLRQKLDDNDSLFVSKLHVGAHSGWLDRDVWAWVDARL